MDNINRFHTNETWLWVRLEQLLLLAVLLVLLGLHLGDVRWLPFGAAFVLPDVFGYLPGMLAYRRAHGGKIAPVFHHLYNFTHSYLAAAAIVGAWAWTLGGFEWAMLALPIHFAGDRGVFGNTYKPAALPFEPAPATTLVLAKEVS